MRKYLSGFLILYLLTGVIFAIIYVKPTVLDATRCNERYEDYRKSGILNPPLCTIENGSLRKITFIEFFSQKATYSFIIFWPLYAGRYIFPESGLYLLELSFPEPYL
jgi:hypothetical protein